MSGVLQRNRTLSDLEFYKVSVELRNHLTRFVMNEKHVPKKYRFVFSIPMTNLFHDLFKNIIQANTIYAYSEYELSERKRYQTSAIANVEEMYQLLDYICETISFDKNDLTYILELLTKDVQLLRAWRKSSKILSNIKSTEPKNADNS